MGKLIPPNIERPKNVQVRTSSTNMPSGLDLLKNAIFDGEIKIALSSLIDTDMSYKVPRISVAQSMINSITNMVSDEFMNAPKEKVENRFSLPKELFEAVDFTNMGVVDETKEYMPTFIVGEKYALKGTSCEGFEMPEKVYELVAVHDEFEGVNINSLIVKQVSGDQDKIFTLSKNDCEHIGIEYENGLQLFPKHLKWRRVKDIIPFDPKNLGTTPRSDIDNTIRYILLKLNGFKDYADGYVVTPSGKLIKEKQFEKTLRITSNEPIVYEQPTPKFDGLKFEENKPFNIEIAYPSILNYNHGNFISSENSVYVLIKLVQPLNGPTMIESI